MLAPSLSWSNLNFDNFYNENEFELKSIAHCSGFLQGVADVFDFLINEYEEEVMAVITEEEKNELLAFQEDLNHFNKITKDELDFQLHMKCGKDVQCRAEIAKISVESFKKGFDNIFMLDETDEGGFNDYAEEYFSDSDILLDLCFDKAEG